MNELKYDNFEEWFNTILPYLWYDMENMDNIMMKRYLEIAFHDARQPKSYLKKVKVRNEKGM